MQGQTPDLTLTVMTGALRHIDIPFSSVCCGFWHNAVAVYRVQLLVKRDLSISGTSTSKSFHHLTRSVDTVWKDVGLLSISRRSGFGYTGVLAEFKLSKRSCAWTSFVCEPCTEFMGMGEAKTELQYLFSWWIHLLSLSSPVSLSRGLTMKHTVLLKEVRVYGFMWSLLVLWPSHTMGGPPCARIMCLTFSYFSAGRDLTEIAI